MTESAYVFNIRRRKSQLDAAFKAIGDLATAA
jgi:hypothetical protein